MRIMQTVSGLTTRVIIAVHLGIGMSGLTRNAPPLMAGSLSRYSEKRGQLDDMRLTPKVKTTDFNMRGFAHLPPYRFGTSYREIAGIFE